VKKSAGGKLEAAARMNDDFVGGLFAGNFFDGLEGHRHGENLLNFGFADVQRHAARLREYGNSSRVLENSVQRSVAGTNFYRYVENNPARFTDPIGNNPFQHWPLNGNLWLGFNKQDEVCTTGPFANMMNSRPCVKKCCKQHDDCLGEACILTADKSPGGGNCKCSK